MNQNKSVCSKLKHAALVLKHTSCFLFELTSPGIPHPVCVVATDNRVGWKI